MHMLYLVFKREFFFFQVTRCFRHLSRLMTKPTKWHVRPAKTDQTGRIRLGIRPVWPSFRCPQEASLHWMHSEDWSDWADVHADLSSLDSDQTGRMPMLISVFTRRTNLFVGLVMGRLCYVGHQSYQINHIPCSKKKSSIQKVPSVCSFFGWYCLPNLAKLE